MKSTTNTKNKPSSQYLIWLIILVFLGLTLLAKQEPGLKNMNFIHFIQDNNFHVCKHDPFCDYLIFQSNSYSTFSKLENDY